MVPTRDPHRLPRWAAVAAGACAGLGLRWVRSLTSMSVTQNGRMWFAHHYKQLVSHPTLTAQEDKQCMCTIRIQPSRALALASSPCISRCQRCSSPQPGHSQYKRRNVRRIRAQAWAAQQRDPPLQYASGLTAPSRNCALAWLQSGATSADHCPSVLPNASSHAWQTWDPPLACSDAA